MMRLSSHPSVAEPRAWIGGFNLLPWRLSKARRARRRCLIEWLLAALFGCVALIELVGWQTFERGRLDAQRLSAEQALAQLTAPLAEHAKLSHDADERVKRAARAVELARPLTRLLDLLDALSNMPAEGVILQQLRQRVHESELLATSSNPVVSADWLKRLSTVQGVKNSEITDLHPLTQGRSGAQAGGGAALEFAARLRWEQDADHEEGAKPRAPTTASASAQSTGTHGRTADKSRGAP